LYAVPLRGTWHIKVGFPPKLKQLSFGPLGYVLPLYYTPIKFMFLPMT
jgi:hypothetical protein